MKATSHLHVLFLLVVLVLSGCGGGGSGDAAPNPPGTVTPPPPSPSPPPPATGSNCIQGSAQGYACSAISLRARVALSVMSGTYGNDLWGWADTLTGREYALMGMGDGTAFVDVTEPQAPVFLGRLTTQAEASPWRDIKVYRDHAYIVADAAGQHGMQVFDLRRLRGRTGGGLLSADSVYQGFSTAHNIAINEVTGFAYAAGTDTCGHGLHMIDLADPVAPVFAGCHAVSYTHDTHCVVYEGPDTEHAGREICVSANENHVEVVDVSDKTNTRTLAVITYPEMGYVHQGWFTDDHRYFLLGDEADESLYGKPTTSHVLDMSDLDAPFHLFDYRARTTGVDHNLYVRGNLVFQANYTDGLRVLEMGDLALQELEEVAYFDTTPLRDEVDLYGAWSVYPYLPSGNLLVSDIEQGLFVLSLDDTYANAGPTRYGHERDQLSLLGSASDLQSLDSVNWTQIAGPEAIIAQADSLNPSVILPDVSRDEKLSFRLTVTKQAGRTSTDTVDIHVADFTQISDLNLADSVLQACVLDQAQVDGSSDIGGIIRLQCQGVNDIEGLSGFANLQELVLTDSWLQRLDALHRLRFLELVDVRGGSSLACNEADQLKARLHYEVTVLADQQCRQATMLSLGTVMFDSAIDRSQERLYVSLPVRREIAVIALSGHTFVDRISVPGRPAGIDLSLDGQSLFVALQDMNAVARINIQTRAVELIHLGNMTGGNSYDVVEAAENRLFVSENFGINFIVQVELVMGNAVSRVADGRVISGNPVFARAPDRAHLYLGGSGSLFKLSLSDPDAGIVLEAGPASVAGTQHIVVSEDGSRIALGSGQILNTASFIEQGNIAPGYSALSVTGDVLMVNTRDGIVDRFDFATQKLLSSVDSLCDLDDKAERLHAYNDDRALALLWQDQICLSGIVTATVPNPYPALTFNDLALQECVQAGAAASGISDPQNIIQLDCSTTGKVIRNLAGLEVLANLEVLNLSGSDIDDLSPVSGLQKLRFLTLQNTGNNSIPDFSSLPLLNTIDVTGSSGIECTQLRALASDGINIEADMCTERLTLDLGGNGSDLVLDAVGGFVYVPVPVLQQVLVVDLADFSIADAWNTSGTPAKIDLSADRNTLYVALNGAGDIAYLDATTGVETVLDISSVLGDDSTFDVKEIAPDRILVSADTNNIGINSYIVEVRRDLGNAVKRVASDRAFVSKPTFAFSPGDSVVYLASGRELYKLDATQSTLPVIYEETYSPLWNTSFMNIHPDGDQLYFPSGHALTTADFSELGRFPEGSSLASADGLSLYVAQSNVREVHVFSTESRHKVGHVELPCTATLLSRLVEVEQNVIVMLSDNILCTARKAAY